MIILDCEQGSPEWHEARLGIPTASGFSRLMTPTGKPSVSLETYLNELLVEALLGERKLVETPAMARGRALEAEARAWYEFETNREVQQVGFVLRDDRLVGCSPDGLLPDSGLEIKVPSAATHVAYLLAGGLPSEYRAQVQGCMWLCERDHWDFLSYHPDLPKLLITVPRDDAYIETLSKQVTALLDKKSQCLYELHKKSA